MIVYCQAVLGPTHIPRIYSPLVSVLRCFCSVFASFSWRFLLVCCLCVFACFCLVLLVFTVFLISLWKLHCTAHYLVTLASVIHTITFNHFMLTALTFSVELASLTHLEGYEIIVLWWAKFSFLFSFIVTTSLCMSPVCDVCVRVKSMCCVCACDTCASVCTWIVAAVVSLTPIINIWKYKWLHVAS